MTFEPVLMVDQAEERIQPYIRTTFLDQSIAYSQRTQSQVYFKCENLQHTGSFKIRGAFNKLLSLNSDERIRGIVTASTGNHGAACAHAMKQIEVRGTVFVPKTAISTKLDAISNLGCEIQFAGGDTVETEAHARAYAAEHNMTYVPPYNDPYIIAGQGTIAKEVLQQLPEADAIFVSVGGGGLIGGIASYLKALRPAIQIVGCSPENSQVMAKSVDAGELLDLPSLPTLSDGTAGGIEPESMTFPLCREYVDQFVSVTEEEIAVSLREFINSQHMLIEGSAAVAIAAFLKVSKSFVGQRVVILLCGANVDLNLLKTIL